MEIEFDPTDEEIEVEIDADEEDFFGLPTGEYDEDER